MSEDLKPNPTTDQYPKTIHRSVDTVIARRATEKVIKELSCRWCSAEPEEECSDARGRFSGTVHLVRMPIDVTPEEFLKQ